MKRLLHMLVAVLLFGATAGAQNYRVEHLPEGSDIDIYTAEADSYNSVDLKIKNGDTVRLVKQSDERYAVVEFRGQKVRMKITDLVWEEDWNEEGVENLLPEKTTGGKIDVPLHSALGRWASGYGVAWIVAVALGLLSLVSFGIIKFDDRMKVIIMCVGSIIVALIEALWGAIGRVDWLIDTHEIGFFMSLVNVAGFFALVAWQFWLLIQTKEFICDVTNVDSDEIPLLRPILLPLPVFVVGLFLVAWLFSGNGTLQTIGFAALLIGIFVMEALYLRRYFVKLGTQWGSLLTLLFIAMLISSFVLIPIAFQMIVFVLCVVAIAAGLFFFASFVVADNKRKEEEARRRW